MVAKAAGEVNGGWAKVSSSESGIDTGPSGVVQETDTQSARTPALPAGVLCIFGGSGSAGHRASSADLHHGRRSA